MSNPQIVGFVDGIGHQGNLYLINIWFLDLFT